MRIAVAGKSQQRTVRTIGLDLGRQPDLAGTALHLVRGSAVSLIEWRKTAPKLDHVAVTIVPLFEQRKVSHDLVDGHDQVASRRWPPPII